MDVYVAVMVVKAGRGTGKVFDIEQTLAGVGFRVAIVAADFILAQAKGKNAVIIEI